MTGKRDDTSAMPPLPPVDFSGFVVSLASSAFVQLGLEPDPTTGQKVDAEPEFARQTIDMLALLKEKTRGNLTEDEARLLDAVLYDLRMRYVQVVSASR